MTAKYKSFTVIITILLMAVAAIFAVTSHIEAAAYAVSDTVVETDYFDILKPEGLENQRQFAVSEGKEYLEENPLLFRLVPNGGRRYSAVSYTDGDTGETLNAEEADGKFLIKLRYNELYTFYLTEDGAEKTVEVNLDNRNLFDLTAPVVDFSKTAFSYKSGETNLNVYINDAVSSRRHITAKSGIKRVTVTAKNIAEPLFEKSDYGEGTGTGNDGFHIEIPSVKQQNGDITAEIEDHAGHVVVISVVVWSDTVKSNARDMLSRADAVLGKEVGEVGLNDRLKNKLTTAIDRLNALLNDENSASLQIREATTSLGTVKEEAENAFKTASGRAYSSIDETLLFSVDGEEYLYGGEVFLSNRKTTDYYGAAKFGDEVTVNLTIKQSTAKSYVEREGLSAPEKFYAFIEYHVSLTVNGEEKTAEKPFFMTVSKTDEYVSPILFAPSGGGYATAECQSSSGWIRFEVSENGVYTAFLKKQNSFPWWAIMLIVIGGVAVVAVTVVVTVVVIKKVRAKKLT